MLYKSIELLLKEQNKTWSDFLLDTKLDYNFISRSLTNLYKISELKTISKYFNISISELLNYSENAVKNISIDITDGNYLNYMHNLIKGVIDLTTKSKLVWVIQKEITDYFSRLPITRSNSVSIIDKSNNYKFPKKNCVFCAYTEFQDSKWVIRKLNSGDLFVNLISVDGILAYNGANALSEDLLAIIKESNGVVECT